MRPISATRAEQRHVGERPGPPVRRVASGSLYRVIWRWHFYAGLLVTPVLLVVAITGALYIFRPEIEDSLHARLRLVEPTPSRLGAQAQVEAARAASPGLTPSSLELSAEPGRSSVVRFEGASPEDSLAVFVDPYRGRVLGSTGPGKADGPAGFFDAVLRLHRELFLGWPGRIVVELTVGWSILLLLTGLYLWWPKGGRGAPGVWWPRLRRAKPYTTLRDLHSVSGFYLLAPMMLIVGTGHFYSLVWGEAFHYVTGGGRASAAKDGAKPGDAREERDPGMGPTGPLLTLDQIEVLARERYPDRNLFITLPGPSDRVAKVAAANDFNKPFGPYVSAQFEFDRFDGRMTSHKTLAEDERYWWHGWVYPLHVGSILGPATKVLWLVACLVLIALPFTGIWMWWSRRPAGRTGFPRRPDRRLPRWLIALIVVLSALLPLVGASIVLILAGEGIVQAAFGSRLNPRRGVA